jgi:hypothetical protein
MPDLHNVKETRHDMTMIELNSCPCCVLNISILRNPKIQGDGCKVTGSPPAKSSSAFLLLVLDAINIVLRNLFMILTQPVIQIIAHISLHRDLFSSTRRLRD